MGGVGFGVLHRAFLSRWRSTPRDGRDDEGTVTAWPGLIALLAPRTFPRESRPVRSYPTAKGGARQPYSPESFRIVERVWGERRKRSSWGRIRRRPSPPAP